MKIILEFNDDEKHLAEQAYRGPEYVMAAKDFRTYLRNVIKHEEYSEETGKYLSNVKQAFYDIFEVLLDV